MNLICAYAVNLDAVCNIHAGDLSRLISPGLAWKEIELKESVARTDDLISSLLFCMRGGCGAEISIESRALASRIEEAFSWQMRLGGNAGIMANVLADLGARTVLNAPAIGSRLAAMLHPMVQVPISGSLAEPGRAAEEREGGGEMVHFVFQFQKGEEMLSGQDRFIVPEDNRFIASYDPVNSHLEASRDFDSYCLENIPEFDGALISGFHLVSFNECRKVFSQKVDQMKSWKHRNPDLFIHLEMGSFQSPQIMSYLLDLIPTVPVDSLGMNEDELGALAGFLSGSPLMKPPGTWRESMQAAELLQDRTGIFRVAVHTRDYILSVMKEGRISAQDEISALQSGVDAAASLAASGSMRAAPPRKFNEKGLNAVEEFRRLGAAACGRGAANHSDGLILSLTPSRLAKQPLITVGLGDTATASIFFRELGGHQERS